MKQKLIFIPGWSGNALVWQYQMLHLVDIADCEVMVLDKQDTLEKMVAAVLENAPERFILCGHSIGAWVAQAVAIAAPRRVAKLILLAAWTGEPIPEEVQHFRKMLDRIENNEIDSLLAELLPTIIHSDRLNDERLTATIKKIQSQFSKEGFINQTKAELNGGDLTGSLAKIKCPTLLIHGRQDTFFTLEEQQAMSDKIPKSKLAIIEDCGHLLALEQPQAVTTLIRLWLDIKSES